MEVFTVGGRKVREMDLGEVITDTMTVTLALTDTSGTPLANGLYYLVFRVSSNQAIGKLLILR